MVPSLLQEWILNFQRTVWRCFYYMGHVRIVRCPRYGSLVDTKSAGAFESWPMTKHSLTSHCSHAQDLFLFAVIETDLPWVIHVCLQKWNIIKSISIIPIKKIPLIINHSELWQSGNFTKQGYPVAPEKRQRICKQDLPDISHWFGNVLDRSKKWGAKESTDNPWSKIPHPYVLRRAFPSSDSEIWKSGAKTHFSVPGKLEVKTERLFAMPRMGL